MPLNLEPRGMGVTLAVIDTISSMLLSHPAPIAVMSHSSNHIASLGAARPAMPWILACKLFSSS